ncbi:MAG TPA: gamma-glutamyltransferase family protein [Candidatus Caldiarchaeum subterraneum]|uniref:Gamma-glutamyltransferase family protein n=1 Tax=Caldiarchaeum subterraneum TaxID=311458 RepID=A0A832ZZH6_CALS0|nr:gamma-glutamyltransferase family protein [Candidatus Caldarchaeum subterraneum]
MTSVAISDAGVVVSDNPHATLAGVLMLSRGGNAFDACVAASAVLGVVLPFTSGLGGDAFMLAKTPGGVHVLMSSGAYPSGVDEKLISEMQRSGVPDKGPQAITIPGLAAAWLELEARFCTVRRRELLSYAISLAENGFKASRMLAKAVSHAKRRLDGVGGWYSLYGSVSEGDTVRNPQLADTMKTLAEKGFEDFYTGDTARRLVNELKKSNAQLSIRDFTEHKAEWTEPITSKFLDYTTYETPPNTQGLTTLQLLRLYQLKELINEKLYSGEHLKKYIKACAVAYGDREKHITDPRFYKAPESKLLSDDHLSHAFEQPKPLWGIGRVTGGDTTFLAAADSEGNLVGFIQSLYYSFGSGVAACGFVFNNRAHGFTGGVNKVERGKRPMHTLSCLLAEGRGRRILIGCAGADLRPQLHASTLALTTAYGMSLEEAVAYPRVLLATSGGDVYLLSEAAGVKPPYANIGLSDAKYPSTEVGLVNALEEGDGFVKAVADLRGEAVALPKPCKGS